MGATKTARTKVRAEKLDLLGVLAVGCTPSIRVVPCAAGLVHGLARADFSSFWASGTCLRKGRRATAINSPDMDRNITVAMPMPWTNPTSSAVIPNVRRDTRKATPQIIRKMLERSWVQIMVKASHVLRVSRGVMVNMAGPVRVPSCSR